VDALPVFPQQGTSRILIVEILNYRIKNINDTIHAYLPEVASICMDLFIRSISMFFARFIFIYARTCLLLA
jgi:hypothetical protein